MKVEHWDKRTDGAFSELSMTSKLKRAGYNVTVYEYAAGTTFPEHQHEIDKLDAVLAGNFKISIGEESLVLRAGDWILIPKGTLHRAEVVGEEPVVCLDGVKRPKF